MENLELVIGDKNISSWSLRSWLALKMTGASFTERQVWLRRENTKAEIVKWSPSGKVPLLRHGSVAIWESLAICEYLAELFPSARLWPESRKTRAVARAVSHEMHAGFTALRQSLPMDIKGRHPTPALTPELDRDISRITEIWTRCRGLHGAEGPFLFGTFTIADAMFAPVTTRFTTYGVALDAVSADYVAAVAALPAMAEWTAAAADEVTPA
ncbi:MAG: glutathione S-transferase family protein [Alphaproteobacteria bacterium]|nr:glutathione S-transferase family protein [Alphaproteobacteria bacterium]